MRPLLAILLSAAILLGVRGYLEFAAAARPKPLAHAADAPEAAEGKFSVEITLTFDAQADAFSLDPVSLVLKRQSDILLQRDDLVPAGEPLIVEDVPQVVAGINEFYFECVPKSDGQHLARAVRLRVLRDGVPVADETLWAAAGQVPRGVIRLDVPPDVSEGAHDH